jgi:hypothetical protein
MRGPPGGVGADRIELDDSPLGGRIGEPRRAGKA